MVFSLTHKEFTGYKLVALFILCISSFLLHTGTTLAACTGACPLQIPKGNMRLLQPLDGSTNSLPPSPDIQIFFQYFNLSWPWVLGVAAGVGVLQALIGGIEIMLSGSDSGLRESGKGKIMWALAGLLMVGLAGFILRSINPIFYT